MESEGATAEGAADAAPVPRNTAVQIGPERWLIPTGCHDCFINVEHSVWKDRDDKWVSVSLLSGHIGSYERGWRRRIKEAWRMLRGYPYTYFEMMEAQEVDSLILTLMRARSIAFGAMALNELVKGDATS